jgi:hypothetical protein
MVALRWSEKGGAAFGSVNGRRGFALAAMCTACAGANLRARLAVVMVVQLILQCVVPSGCKERKYLMSARDWTFRVSRMEDEGWVIGEEYAPHLTRWNGSGLVP